MKPIKSFSLQVSFLLSVGFLVLPSLAHAYIDPGVGSMMLQAILAAIFGAIVLLKMFWRRVADFFGRLLPFPRSVKEKNDS